MKKEQVIRINVNELAEIISQHVGENFKLKPGQEMNISFQNRNFKLDEVIVTLIDSK
jgi:hypothetical protein